MRALNISALIEPYDVQHYLVNAIKNTIKTKKGFSNKQIEIEIPSGEKRIFDVSCTPLQNVGEDNLLMIVHDVTVHKQIEREREDIMGFVAHELRNPLANIILCNEVMSEAIRDNEIDVLADMLERNKNNVTRLQKMITELYEATRINSGYLQLEVSTFNFGEMVKEAIVTIEVLQPSFNIVLKDDTNFEVTADRYRLIQVITNYLSNGIKYSNGKTEVSLSVIHDENSVTVSVKDEGLGISKEQLPFVFERFFRVEKTRNIEGIGLGLYLCQQIIHAHKGIVWAESEEGKGSTFYFSIPLNFQLS
jgi:signal transduction histidine kinase